MHLNSVLIGSSEDAFHHGRPVSIVPAARRRHLAVFGVGVGTGHHHGDARADRRDAAFGRTALPRAEYGHRAWCLRGFVYRGGSTVQARDEADLQCLNNPSLRRYIAV